MFPRLFTLAVCGCLASRIREDCVSDELEYTTVEGPGRRECWPNFVSPSNEARKLVQLPFLAKLG